MKAPAFPADEAYRLDALRSLDILDTGADDDFDAIVKLAQELFQVPICLVSLIDDDRQWFKACIGLDTAETSREISFCGHAILGEGAFVVLDATKDERFADNPLVIGPPNIRFYAGIPIRLPSGYQVGTVCIIDRKPRASFDENDRRLLSLLAEMAVTAMALRGLRGDLTQAQLTIDRFRAAMQLSPVPLAIADPKGRIEEANGAFNALCRADPMGGLPAGDLLAVPAEQWSAAASAPDEAEIRTGTDGGRIRVVQDAGGMILVGTPEPQEADASNPGERTDEVGG